MYASPFDDAFGVFVALFLCLFLRWRGGRLGKGDGTVFFFCSMMINYLACCGPFLSVYLKVGALSWKGMCHSVCFIYWLTTVFVLHEIVS